MGKVFSVLFFLCLFTSCARIEEKWQDIELLVHKNKFEEALNLCYKLLERESDSNWRFRIQRKIGLIQHYSLKNPQKAIFAYRQAMELAQTPVEVSELVERIANVHEDILLNLGNAITEYQRFLYHYPKFIEADRIQLKIAALSEKMGHYRQAYDEYKKIFTLYPGSYSIQQSQYKMAQMLLLQQKYKEALEQFRLYSQRYPDSKQSQDALFESALCLEQMGQVKKAIEVLRQLKNYSRPEILAQRIQKLEQRYRVRKR